MNGVEGAGLSEGEKRKASRKAKKAAAKDPGPPQVAAGKKKDAEESEQTGPLLFNPQTLLNTETPLDEAVKFLSPLIQLQSPEVKVYLLGFEVYFRRKKVLLMLQCLNRAQILDPANVHLHLCRVKFLHFYEGKTYEGVMGEVMEAALNRLFGSVRSPVELNAAFEAANPGSLPHRMVVSEAWKFLGKRTEQMLDSVISLDSAIQGRTWKNCHRVLKRLERGTLGAVPAERIAQYRTDCHRLFPLAECFAPPGSTRAAKTDEDENNHHQDEIVDGVGKIRL